MPFFNFPEDGGQLRETALRKTILFQRIMLTVFLLAFKGEDGLMGNSLVGKDGGARGKTGYF
jgi:hypothetical protein